jgi:hypothetical protein
MPAQAFSVSRRVYASLQKKGPIGRRRRPDKMKSDLASMARAWFGRSAWGCERDGRRITILSREEDLSLAQDAAEGQSSITGSTKGWKAGREICLSSPGKADMLMIAVEEPGRSPALAHSIRGMKRIYAPFAGSHFLTTAPIIRES